MLLEICLGHVIFDTFWYETSMAVHQSVCWRGEASRRHISGISIGILYRSPFNTNYKSTQTCRCRRIRIGYVGSARKFIQVKANARCEFVLVVFVLDVKTDTLSGRSQALASLYKAKQRLYSHVRLDASKMLKSFLLLYW